MREVNERTMSEMTSHLAKCYDGISPNILSAHESVFVEQAVYLSDINTLLRRTTGARNQIVSLLSTLLDLRLTIANTIGTTSCSPVLLRAELSALSSF